jgi:MFS transporter, OFA family, oxalate/formate antiporter
VNNRWFQLGASLLAMIMIANLQYAWTLFVKPLQHNTGWSLSDIQWAFTLFILCQTWVQPLEGWLIDRMGQRIFISAAGVLCGAGWAGLGYAKTLPMLYGLYAAAGIGAALVYSASIGSALKWFSERRGLASGIMAAGFGGGTALFIPVISSTIQWHGYQTAFIRTGIFQGLVILGVAQFLRHPPVEALSAATARTSGRSIRVGAHQFTTGEMLTKPQFYVLYAMFVLMATGGLLVTAQTGPMAQSWGLTAAALTLAASLSPLANGASRILWGWASDRMGRETTMATAFLLQAGCLLLVIKLGRLSGTWFALTVVLTYLTWGEIYSLFPSTLGDYFGTRHATSNYSVLYTAKGVASIIGGGLAALLYERFGSWSSAFYGSAALAFVAALMAFGLRAASAPVPAPVGALAPPE